MPSVATPTIKHEPIQFEQADFLTSQGFVLKNTFIDGPAQWWEIRNQRAHSAPAEARFTNEHECRTPKTPRCASGVIAHDSCKGMSRHKSINCSASLSPQISTCSESEMSTTCTESDEYDSNMGNWLEKNPAGEQTAHQILELVERECSFFKLFGRRLYNEIIRMLQQCDRQMKMPGGALTVFCITLLKNIGCTSSWVHT